VCCQPQAYRVHWSCFRLCSSILTNTFHLSVFTNRTAQCSFMVHWRPIRCIAVSRGAAPCRNATQLTASGVNKTLAYNTGHIVTDPVCTGGNAIVVVRPSVCFNSNYWTEWPLIFCVYMGHGIKGHGQTVKVKVSGRNTHDATLLLPRSTTDARYIVTVRVSVRNAVGEISILHRGQFSIVYYID